MTSAIRWVGVVACVVLIGASCVFAQDWPQWRGPNRDGKAVGFAAPETWPKELAQKWKTKVGTGDSTPALVGDKLYVFSRQGGDEVTYVPGRGHRKGSLERQVRGPGRDRAVRYGTPGPEARPRWRTARSSRWGRAGSSPAWTPLPARSCGARTSPQGGAQVLHGHVADHRGRHGHRAARRRGQGAIIAFDLATGDVKWKWDGEGPGYASPVVMTVDGIKQIVTLTEKSVVGLRRGRREAPVADSVRAAWAWPTTRPRRSSTGQTVIFTGSSRGAKAVKIEKQGDAFAAKELWSNPELAPQFNTPVLKDGLLFGLSEKRNLFCIDAKTGKTAWTDSNRLSNFGAIVDAGSVLLALPESSGLIVFKPSDKKLEEVARIKVSDTPIYAAPVAAGKMIYVKDQNTVTAWAVE